MISIRDLYSSKKKKSSSCKISTNIGNYFKKQNLSFANKPQRLKGCELNFSLQCCDISRYTYNIKISKECNYISVSRSRNFIKIKFSNLP